MFYGILLRNMSFNVVSLSLALVTDDGSGERVSYITP